MCQKYSLIHLGLPNVDTYQSPNLLLIFLMCINKFCLIASYFLCMFYVECCINKILIFLLTTYLFLLYLCDDRECWQQYR